MEWFHTLSSPNDRYSRDLNLTMNPELLAGDPPYLLVLGTVSGILSRPHKAHVTDREDSVGLENFEVASLYISSETWKILWLSFLLGPGYIPSSPLYIGSGGLATVCKFRGSPLLRLSDLEHPELSPRYWLWESPLY